VFLPLALGEVRQQQGQFHVPLRREHGQQIVKLEHEADMARPPRSQSAARQRIGALATDGDRALRRLTCQQVECLRIRRELADINQAAGIGPSKERDQRALKLRKELQGCK